MLARAVAAGFPSPADDHAEQRVDLNALLVRNAAATFLVRVSGWSMVGKGLSDGDIAVVDRSLEPLHGDVVVVDVDGERSFKVLEVAGGRRTLRFANPDLPEFELGDAAVVEVWGVVCASVNPNRRADAARRRPRRRRRGDA